MHRPRHKTAEGGAESVGPKRNRRNFWGSEAPDPKHSLVPGLRGSTVWGILAALFSAFAAVGAVLPVLPRYVRDELGAGNSLVGVVITASAVATIVARPVAGHLAERRGRRPIMLLGAALVAVAGGMYLTAVNVPALLVARLVLGVGEGFVFTAAALWIVSVAPADRRGQLVGFAGLAMWTGLSIGPLLGSWLLEARGYLSVWLAAALLPVIAAVAIRLLPDPAERAPARRGPLIPAAAIRPGLGMALGSVGYAALAAFLVLHLRAHGVRNGATALAAYGAAYVLTRLLGGQLPDRLGSRRVVLYAGLVEAGGLLIVAGADRLETAIIGALLTGAGLSLLYPSLALIVLNNTSPGEQGAALGAYTSFWDLGLGLAGPLVGTVASVLDYPAAFLVAAACAGGAVVVTQLWTVDKPPEVREAADR